MLCNFSYWCMTKVITNGPATTSVSNNRPSVIRCKAVNSVTVTEIPVQLEPMLTSPTSAMHCGVRKELLFPELNDIMFL